MQIFDNLFKGNIEAIQQNANSESVNALDADGFTPLYFTIEQRKQSEMKIGAKCAVADVQTTNWKHWAILSNNQYQTNSSCSTTSRLQFMIRLRDGLRFQSAKIENLYR